MRENFLSRELDLTSLGALNARFIEWAEDQYNHRVHGTLGMKPIDRFGLDLDRVRYLPLGPHADDLFLRECVRAVMADNTFRFNGQRWEAPRDLRSRQVQCRHGVDERGNGSRTPHPACWSSMSYSSYSARHTDSRRLSMNWNSATLV